MRYLVEVILSEDESSDSEESEDEVHEVRLSLVVRVVLSNGDSLVEGGVHEVVVVLETTSMISLFLLANDLHRFQSIKNESLVETSER